MLFSTPHPARAQCSAPPQQAAPRSGHAVARLSDAEWQALLWPAGMPDAPTAPPHGLQTPNKAALAVPHEAQP